VRAEPRQSDAGRPSPSSSGFPLYTSALLSTAVSPLSPSPSTSLIAAPDYRASPATPGDPSLDLISNLAALVNEALNCHTDSSGITTHLTSSLHLSPAFLQPHRRLSATPASLTPLP
jgi:hypothetical protein